MKIFLIIALFVASSLQFLLDYIWPEESKARRYKIVRGLLFILILIVFMTSITTEIRDEKEKGELKELAGKSITLLKENKKIAGDNKLLNEKIALKNEEIVILSKKIVDKSGQIEKLNQKALQAVTGGSSYPYIFPFLIQEGGRTVLTLVLSNPGEFPLYDLKIQIADVNKYKKLFGNIFDKKSELLSVLNSPDWQKVRTTFHLNTLTPKENYNLRSFELSEDLNLFFDITARNGFFFEKFSIRKVNNEWKNAFVISKISSNIPGSLKYVKDTTKLMEALEPGFPRDGKGEILW